LRRETKAGREARLAYYDAIFDKGGCWFYKVIPHECDGVMDPCHLLEKKILKVEATMAKLSKAETLALVWDRRNGLPGCRMMHNRLDNGFLRIYQPELPQEIHDFVSEWEARLETPGRLQLRLDKRFPREDRPE
jgi:hypothetical protein